MISKRRFWRGVENGKMVYKCRNCGKRVTVSDSSTPICCDKPMKKLSLDICLQPAHAETNRPMDAEDACNEFREG